jgi:lipopolysaccharide/colanic/teichoic acid biosynthesis glycosyltransferase
MRYQYPAPNPLAHYWEEEITLVWGIRLRFQERLERFMSFLFGELLLANAFLLFELTYNLPAFVSFRRVIALTIVRIDLGIIAKRIIDVAGATLGFVLTSPFWVIMPLLIKLDSGGPVFYQQERVGQNRRRKDRRAVILDGIERRSLLDRRTKGSYGKSFMIVKFRSMCQDAEKATGPTWASKNDPRVTRVGRIMRAARIDEIPQLINVLKGDMSLVGPRPERPFFVQELDAKVKDYTARFNAKPGITGLAQVEHKYDENLADVSRKVTYDLRYIRSWSIFQDLRIIMKTVVVVLSARGM